MMSRWRTRATVTACAIAATLLVSSRPVALARGAVERFTAFAVDIGHPGKTFAGQVEIVVDVAGISMRRFGLASRSLASDRIGPPYASLRDGSGGQPSPDR